MRPRLLAPLLFLALLDPEPRAAAAAPVPARPTTLPNGLEFFVRPILGAKLVALVTVFRVGEFHDPAKKSGLAHLVEHCYVTAAAGETPVRPYAALLERYAAGHNAQTGDRHTIVAQVFPPERLEEELKDAAARMGGLRITADDLDREKPRVVEELANMYGMPVLAARNRARWRLHHQHSHTRGDSQPGGLPDHVGSMTLEEVAGRWRRHYKAGNAVLALAGAVDEAKAKLLVTAAFAGVGRGEPPPPPPAPAALGTVTEPPVFEFATAEPMPGVRSRVAVAYAAPPPTSPDHAPFLLFVARLLEARIPREGFAPPVVFAPLDEPGTLYLTAPLADGETPDAAAAALRAHAAEAVGRPWSPSDAPRIERTFGFLLGLTDPDDSVLAGNPYGVALGLAARRVLGIDPEALARAVAGLRTAPLAAAGARLFDPLKSRGASVQVKR